MGVSEKRLNEEGEVSASVKKKAKLNYTLRDQLKSDKKVEALNTFLESCKNTETRSSFIDEYLGHGGNCLELLHLLEEPEVQPTIILEIAHYVLLKVLSDHPELHNATLEACRYLLNTHIALINKMLAVSSGIKERKALLKVLTVIVTFSPNLARDILLHVNFNQDNVRVFSKHFNAAVESVRNVYIQFLTSFLIDGHFPTISLFIEKQILLQSVIDGLQYDVAETVCFFVTTLKTKVLESNSMYKTLKMKAFTTNVVTGLLKLYDWVGPQGFNSKAEVTDDNKFDEMEKNKVVECVHSFLLVLCTSHKHGVIFTDKTLGLGQKNMNSLLYSIVINIKSPWDNPFKADLVTRICIACPDLIRRVFDGLVQYLEPTSKSTWFSVVDFTCGIISNITPQCIEGFAKDFNEHQILQILKTLIIPSSILKKLAAGDENSARITTKILKLHCLMLKKTTSFIESFKTWYDKETFSFIKSSVQEHILNYFATAFSILKVLETASKKTFDLQFFQCLFQIIELYDDLCPPLLQDIPSNINIEYLLSIIEGGSKVKLESQESLKVKCIKLFYIFDSNGLNVNNKIFAISISTLCKYYYETKDVEAKNTLRNIFKFSGIFESCDDEINIWINAIFDFDEYTEVVVDFMYKTIKQAADNLIDYSAEIASMNNNYEEYSKNINLGNVLNTLTIKTDCHAKVLSLKNICCSPLILAAFDKLKSKRYSNNEDIQQYINLITISLFHLQTNPEPFIDLVEKNESLLSNEVIAYIKSWKNQPITLTKIKGNINQFSTLSKTILSNDIKLVENYDFNAFDDLKLNTLQMLTFYIANLGENLTKQRYTLILELTKTLITNNHDYVLNNTRLIKKFSPTHTRIDDYKYLSSQFIITCIQMSKTSSTLIDLSQYRIKLSKVITKVLNNFNSDKSYPILKNAIEVIGLDYQESYALIEKISNANSTSFVYNNTTTTIIYDILIHVLKTLSTIDDSIKHLTPLNNTIILKIIEHVVHLNKLNINTAELSKSILLFLQKYPHYYKLLPEELFKTILKKKEYCRDSSNLAGEIFTNSPKLLSIYEKSLNKISTHKGLYLLLLDKACELNINEAVLKKAYDEFEAVIIKALERPQKANQHFHLYYKGLCHLIVLFMPEDKAKAFIEKVCKFECVEEFHVNMLRAMYEKYANKTNFENVFYTFIHLITNIVKQESKVNTKNDSNSKSERVVKEFIAMIVNLKLGASKINFDDTLKAFYILLLRFGLGEKHILLNLLTRVTECINFSEENAQDIMAMMISHSDFFNYIFSDHNDTKKEIFDLFLALIKQFPAIMSREHLPFILGAYSATINPSDIIILQILQCYESQPDKTNFFDFKPLLWGSAARNQYSLKSSVQSVLWKQPKTGDVLNILQQSWVNNTIYNYPLDLNLNQNTHPQVENASRIYDLSFLLPLFSQLLLPENTVQTLIFAKSGALSLSLVGLSCNNEEIRKASCHVISRYYNQLYINHKAKFNTLCIRFIEALCKGTAAIKNFKLNNFSAIFFAQMALVLTNPSDSMYLPLTTYLGSRPVLNLATIPELYTFLHSSETNYMEQNIYILKILNNGLRIKDDFEVLKNTKAQKLLLGYFSSAVSNNEIKNLVMSIFKKACNFEKSARTLCSKYGLIPFLNNIILTTKEITLLSHVIHIIHALVQHKAGSLKRLFFLYKLFLTEHIAIKIKEESKLSLLKGMNLIQKQEKLFSSDLIRNAAVIVNNKEFEYLYLFHSEYYCKPKTEDFDYYIRELTKNILK